MGPAVHQRNYRNPLQKVTARPISGVKLPWFSVLHTPSPGQIVFAEASHDLFQDV